MGTRALPGAWLLGGDDVPDLLAEKGRILDEHHDEAFATLDGTEAAGEELLAEVRVALGRPGVPEHGTKRQPVGPPAHAPRLLRARDTSSPGDQSSGLHPLDVAGRLVAEDLCLLKHQDGGREGEGRPDERPEGAWVLAAGSVCFPSHWRLREKLGRPVAEVHGPVPHYDTELASRVDRFLDRLRVGPGVWRRNWTIHTDARLFAPVPPPPPDPPVTVADAAERLWFRSEYQTLRRLPRTGAIVFGIRTQQVPLGHLARRPERCRQLAATAAAWSSQFLAYRGGEELRRPLVAWLQTAGAVPDR